MKTFRCDTCNAPVYFENIRCLGCGSTLGILPGTYEVHSVHEQSDGTFTDSDGLAYRLCRNSVEYGACNQLVPEGDSSPFCISCQYTEITPDLGYEVNRELWAGMEKAKRRLLYSLVHLGIVPPPKTVDSARGLSFRFPVDYTGETKTGYENGVITITLAEADDAIRETRRQQRHPVPSAQSTSSSNALLLVNVGNMAATKAGRLPPGSEWRGQSRSAAV